MQNTNQVERERERERERENKKYGFIRVAAIVGTVSVLSGAAAGQPTIPTFDGGTAYVTLPEIDSVAVTPPGFDLVGTSLDADPKQPDGYPEIAIGAPLDGLVRFYRNENNWNDPSNSLSTIFTNDLDVLTPLGLTSIEAGGTAILHDIALVDMTGDGDPDLVIAVEFDDEISPNVFTQRGVIALFNAAGVGTNQFSFVLRDSETLDLPVERFTFGDYNQDGRPDILAAAKNASANQTLDPARVFVLRNDTDANGNAGFLTRLADQTLPTSGTTTPLESLNVVAGQFSTVLPFPAGTGNKLDFVTFGGDPFGGIRMGIGNSVGPFTFSTVSTTGTTCGQSSAGLGNGISPADVVYPLVLFDPFSNPRQSLATTAGSSSLNLLHNNPRGGSFFHLCNSAGSADFYDLTPCDGTSQSQLLGFDSWIAKGNLNGDAFDDLVHIDPQNRNAAFLLGLGTPDANKHILAFNCDQTIANYYIMRNYAPDYVSAADRVVCTDLDLDGYDDVIITRNGRWEPNTWKFIVFVNTTGP